MADDSILNISLDDYFKTTHIGSIDRAIGNNLYGINHSQTPTAVPDNKDVYGLTFFTRPQLNLQPDNIRNVRLFYPLLTKNPLSVQMAVRCLLDPRLIQGYSLRANGNVNKSSLLATPEDFNITQYNTPLVDNQMAFIPILTNNLNSISGWPDIVAPTFDSKPGLFNDVYSQVDGITRNYESFDIDASFRNTKGDPIIYMFYIWMHYASYVFKGDLVPYLDFITENEIDYNTRIYRLVLDKFKNKVTKIAATGASFPISLPTGSFFDYNNDKPFNDQNKDFTIRFRCNGVDYLDDILIYEFNETVCIFNPSMKDNQRVNKMTKIPKNLLPFYKNRGYPRIEPDTYELEWWLNKEQFMDRTQGIIDSSFQDFTPTNPDEVQG